MQDFVVIARTRMDNIIVGGWGGLRRAFVAFALILFTPTLVCFYESGNNWTIFHCQLLPDS